MMGVASAVWLLGIAPASRASGQAAPLDSAAAIAVLRSTCGGDIARSGTGLLRGEARDVEALPVGSVAVTIAWRRPLDAQSGGNRPGVTTDKPVLGRLTDAQGRWHICGAPLHTELSIRAVADEGSDDRIATLDEAHPVASVDFSLRLVAAGDNATRSARTSALVVFSVEDRNGNSLAGVTLDVVPANGPARRVVTDSAGRAIVPAIEPGRARVNSLGIGYRPGELSVPLDVGRNTVPLILDAARIPTLATVRVIGDREVLARHREFEMRRSLRQTTASITAEDIEKRNPVDTWQMLTNVPSMRVIQYGSGAPGVFAMSTREQRVVQRRDGSGGGTSVPCWYRVMPDGVTLPDATPDLSTVLPSPSDVHGIEVFAGLATIPPQYNSMVADGQGGSKSPACGLIAIWTK
jgi:hypothetical protein